MKPHHTLTIEGLHAGYGGRDVLDGIDLQIQPGEITAIIGPNGCGKSTCLRAAARLLVPHAGRVLLDGRSVHSLPTRALARELGLLPQAPLAPEGIGVRELVSRGRTPHKGLTGRWTAEDDHAVARALELCGLGALAQRDVDSLSGGQRQRAWIALALAQDTDILLLDEPTTYLDIVHQMDVLELLRALNRRDGVTVVMVLHDLNMAARYADRVIAMAQGKVIASGAPGQVFAPAVLAQVFGLEAQVIADPVAGTPMIVPIGRVNAA